MEKEKRTKEYLTSPIYIRRFDKTYEDYGGYERAKSLFRQFKEGKLQASWVRKQMGFRTKQIFYMYYNRWLKYGGTITRSKSKEDARQYYRNYSIKQFPIRTNGVE